MPVLKMPYVLVHPGWAADEQHKFISHSPGGREVQDQGPGRFSVWRGSTPGSQMAVFSLCPHVVDGARGFSGVSYKGTSSIHEDSTLVI